MRHAFIEQLLTLITLWQLLNHVCYAQTDTLIRIGQPTGLEVATVCVDHRGVVFAGTRTGGVYRSTDRGDTWARADGELISSEVRCFATDVLGNLYAGTLKGMFRSSDGGSTWTKAGTFDQYISSIATNSRGDIFACGPFLGIFRSSDYGTNWVSIDTGLGWLSVNSLAAKSDGVIFAAGHYRGRNHQHGGVYRSTNYGCTWCKVTQGLRDTQDINLAISPNGYLFAACGVISDEELAGLYRSTDDGDHWEQVRECHGMLDFPLAVSIDDRGRVVFILYMGDILLSTDNGNTWSEIGSRQSLHEGRTAASDSTGRIYIATMDGIFWTDQAENLIRNK